MGPAEIWFCSLFTSLPIYVVGRGCELIVTVASSPSAEVTGEKEEGSAEEVRRIRRTGRTFSHWFGSVVCPRARICGGRAHLEGSLTYGEMSQVLKHLSLVSSSFPPLQVFLAYVHHLYWQHVLATQEYHSHF